MSAMNSLHHGGRTRTTSASAIEQLQSLIKQKEGELVNAQVQLLAYASSYSSLGTHFSKYLKCIYMYYSQGLGSRLCV